MPLSHFVPAYPSPSPCPQVHSLRLHLYGHLIFDKGDKIYNGEKTASSVSGAGKTGQLHVKE